MLPRVLIVDKMHESLLASLREAGFDPDYQPQIDRKHILEIIDRYEGLVVRSKTQVDAELINQASHLRFVARAGAGIDNIDYPLVQQRNIKLINAPEGNRDALGEHTMGMLLVLFHKILTSDREVKSGKWNREGNRGWEIKGKTVGIFGYGYMGSAFAEKLRGFDCRVIAYDKYKEGIKDPFVEQVDLESFRKETEILSLHVPLTSETRFLFDEDYLSDFPRLRVVLNTSRGEVLKLSALLALLKKEKLIGAGLDVLENEKLNTFTPEQAEVFSELSKMDNVILTPHIAGWTFESYERINEVLISKLQVEGLTRTG